MSNSRRRLAQKWAGINTPAKRIVRLLDLPGFRALEDKFVIFPGIPLDEPWCADLSLKTFGLTRIDTLYLGGYEPDDLSDAEYKSHRGNRAAHDSKFETANVDDFKRVEILKRLGLDFTNDYGKPLKCTAAFCRQAELAIKQLRWKPADVLGRVEVMSARLEDEAAAWLAAKRRG